MEFTLKPIKNKLAITLPDKTKLTFYPPKIKVCRQIEEISRAVNEGAGEWYELLTEMVGIIINQNNEKIEFTREDIEDRFNPIEARDFCEKYTEFVTDLGKN